LPAKPPYYHRNTGKPWTDTDVKALKLMAKEDTPTPVIGVKLGRTVAAVYSKASDEEISLMPPNPHHKKK
jgi:hypothetical protein